MIRGIVGRSVTVGFMAFCVMLIGIVTYNDLPREAAPDVEVPFVIVSTPYPGVSPSDIESLVTNPLEDEIAGLDGLKKLSSTSAEGVSILSLEFETDVIIEDALQRVRDRVNRAKPELPDDVEETEVNEVSFSAFPIIIVTIAGPVDEVVLKKLGEDLQDKVERMPGVLKAEVTGGRERQVRVQVDPLRLGYYGLSLNDVIGAVSDENVNIPGGDLAVGDSSVLLRVPGEFDAPQEIENIAVKRVGDRTIFVRDVASVDDGFADRATYSRMNGVTSVSLAVSKRTGANIEEVANGVKRLAAKEMKSWPEGVTFQALGDQSELVSTMVGDLENGILTALLLVVMVIMFFMGVRNSVFVAVSIPLSFLMGIILLAVFGITLNMVVLFSLILVLGMLVDNAIVIVENIYRHAEMGKEMKEAAVIGTQEVALAVTASTATTVAAFFPLVFWGGIMGEFMGYLPKTVILVLVSSLIVAIGVLPVLTAVFMKVNTNANKKTFADNPLLRRYANLLHFSIRHRYIMFIGGLVSLFGTCGAYASNNHGTEFFPESEPNRAIITLKAPDGTDIEATDAIVRKIEAVLAKEENVDVYVAEVGVAGSGQDPAEASQSAQNQARITVDFLPDAASALPGDKVRVENSEDTVERLRQVIEIIPGAEIQVEKERMGPPVGKPISVEVSGEDFHQVGEYAAKVRRELAAIEGSAKLTDNYRVGRPEMRLRIDREAAKRVGASTRAVAGTVRTALAGTEASSLRGIGDDVDIIVEFHPRSKRDLQALLALRIPGRLDTSPDTFPVPLSSVARYELAGGSGSIRHIDQKLVVTISGDIAEGFNENDVRGAVVEWIEKAEAPPGLDIRLGGANDEQVAAQEFLSRAFGIALILIFVVLIAQFNRLSLPIIVLMSVVLSLIGVLIGLMLTGTPFGIIMTGLGVISLAGVVVNNAIVLLDYVEQLRDRGIVMVEALVEAGTARFRPVMLTALTTILGLVPMALGISVNFAEFEIAKGTQSTQWWSSMAIAVIFGLAFATVLTLVMVPTMYSIAEDLRLGFARMIGRKPNGRLGNLDLRRSAGEQPDPARAAENQAQRDDAPAGDAAAAAAADPDKAE